MLIHQCTICEQSKPRCEFRYNPRFGIRTECRECEKVWLRCTQCKEVKPHEEFPPDKKIKTGRHSVCNACHGSRVNERYHGDEKVRARQKAASQGERAKAWRRQHWQDIKEKPGRKEKRNEYMRWLYHSDPIHRLKVKARSLVAHAVGKGQLIRPEKCEECYRESRELEGHHYAGYWPRATWLMVKWLCSECHARADAQQPTDKLFIGSGLPELAEMEAKVNIVAATLGLDQDGILMATTDCLGEDECHVFLNVIAWLAENGYKITKQE